MKTETSYPKVSDIRPLEKKCLHVTFANGEARIYDCTPLLDDPPFAPLRNESLFQSVHADSHGYGVSWNDTIDLSESELWLNGKPA